MNLYNGYTEEPQKETAAQLVIGQEDIIMADNAIISQSAVPTDNNYLTNKKYVDNNTKKLKGVADGNINIEFYKIKQTMVPTDNYDVINKSYSVI